MSENEQEGRDRMSFRLTPDEMLRVERLMEYLKSKAGKFEKVTQKRLFLEGLEALEQKYSKAMKDRERRARVKASEQAKGERNG
jgi:hypothetical protein